MEIRTKNRAEMSWHKFHTKVTFTMEFRVQKKMKLFFWLNFSWKCLDSLSQLCIILWSLLGNNFTEKKIGFLLPFFHGLFFWPTPFFHNLNLMMMLKNNYINLLVIQQLWKLTNERNDLIVIFKKISQRDCRLVNKVLVCQKNCIAPSFSLSDLLCAVQIQKLKGAASQLVS